MNLPRLEMIFLKHGGRKTIKYNKLNWTLRMDHGGENDSRRLKCAPKVRHFEQGTIYFDYEEDLKKVIEIVGEETILDLMFPEEKN